MSLAILLFSMLATAGKFADFIIGKRGQRQVNDRMVAWYVELGSAPWSRLALASADSVDRFLTRLLGDAIVSRRALLRILILNVGLDIALITIAYALLTGWAGVRLFIFTHFRWAVLPIVLSNTIVNFVALSGIRLTYRSMRELRSRWTIAAMALLDAMIAYVGAASAVLLTVTTSISIIAWSPDYGTHGEFWLMLLHQKAWACFSRPWRAPMSVGGINFSLFALSAVFPTILHLLTFMTFLSFSFSKRFAQRPVMLLLERLEEAPNGVFTAIGIAIGAIGAILAASVPVFK